MPPLSIRSRARSAAATSVGNPHLRDDRAALSHRPDTHAFLMTKPSQHVSPFSAGLRCRCPECGEGKLFSGFLTVTDKCDRCGLDLRFADSGDGPVFFIVLLVGAIVTASALTVEVLYMPPYWVHLALWLPLTLGLSLWLMRPFKGVLVALQHRHGASEGRLNR